MEPAVYFITRERREEEGAGGALLVSIIVHSLLVAFLLVKQTSSEPIEEPPLRYVDIVETQTQEATPLPVQPVPDQRSSAAVAREFLEAPGPDVGQAPENAPLSNADRRASIPTPTGDQPTDRPGVGGFHIPGASGPPVEPVPPSDDEGTGSDRQSRDREQADERVQGTNGDNDDIPRSEDPFGFRVQTGTEGANEDGTSDRAIDWDEAIQDAGRIPTIDPGAWGAIGGDQGFAESGQLSFETQWYPWGDYADHMVRKIRYHWYNNIPQLIRMGVKGVVVVRFTIQRDGRITDIAIMKSSGSPPYDFAARKSIELSSPLRPLPDDFPNPNERVTAAFYYNQSPPR